MVEIERESLIATLAELIRIPSINPDLNPGTTNESEIANHIANRLRQTPGITVEMQYAGADRPNVIATVGNGNGRTLMLNGHTDTVGVAGMESPFEPAIQDGKLYGRGACDMKDAVAAMIVLLEEFALAGDLDGKLVCTFVVDEEYASIGTQAICREIDRWKPDAALVLEWSNLDVCIAHKGFVWATITTRGHAAHGSRYEEGIDAILHMGRVLSEIDSLSAELLTRKPHQHVGPPSMHASTIRGGQELSSYPDECVLEIERRTIPGETAEQVERELQEILDRLAADDPQFKASLEMGLVREPFGISEDAEIVQIVRKHAEAHSGRQAQLLGGMGWMDSALLADAGVPTAIFGSDGDGAHAILEWSELDTLHTFAQALAGIVREFCAG